MGVQIASDQRLEVYSDKTTTPTSRCNPIHCNTDGTDPEQRASLPEVLCVGNLRHVAPYFVQKDLPVGKLAKGKSIGQALGIHSSSSSSSSSSNNNNKQKLGTVVKNVALIDWWPKELIGGRLILKNQQQQQRKRVHDNKWQENEPESTSSHDNGDQPTCTIIATPDHVIREGDILEGRYHFHEQSVLDRPVPTIVYQDKNYVAVNKPGGIDVLSNPDAHRVINSLPGIVLLGSGGAPSPLLRNTIVPAHRIDNPVSGLVCCGTTNKDAKRLSRRIQCRETTKTYLARVKIGTALDRLPLSIEAPLGFDSSNGICLVDPLRGKPSSTTVLSVLVPKLDDGTCVVAVRPHTGRKHQLRKHLAHAGIPIANDEKYNKNKNMNNSSTGREVPARVSAFGLPNPPNELVRLFEDRYLEHCDHCRYARRLLGANGQRQPTTEDTGPTVSRPIWLHSWRYEFPSLGLSFEASPPEWAHPQKWRDGAKKGPAAPD